MRAELRIKNVGSIEEARVDIKPLTIVAGKNGTGKTFITKGFYSILDALTKNLIKEKIEKILNQIKLFSVRFNNEISRFRHSNKEYIEISNYLKILYSKLEELNIVLKKNITLYDEAIKLIKDKGILEVIEKIYINLERVKRRVKRFFKANNLPHNLDTLEIILNELRNLLKEKEYIKILGIEIKNKLLSNLLLDDLNSLINLGKNKAFVEIEFKNNLPSLNLEISQNKVLLRNNIDNIKDINLILNIKNPYYLDSPVYIKIKDGILSGYTPEYIEKLINSMKKRYLTEENKEKNEILKEIHNIIGGRIEVDDFGNLYFKEKIKDKEINIPISITAMGKTNIGLIEWLIRYDYIKEGSFLIIDEPEVHLHPSWQKKYMYILYMLAKYGINVIVATHSIDMVYALGAIYKKDKEAKDYIAINKLPYSEEFYKKDFLEKLDEIIEDLGESFIDTFFEVE